MRTSARPTQHARSAAPPALRPPCRSRCPRVPRPATQSPAELGAVRCGLQQPRLARRVVQVGHDSTFGSFFCHSLEETAKLSRFPAKDFHPPRRCTEPAPAPPSPRLGERVVPLELRSMPRRSAQQVLHAGDDVAVAAPRLPRAAPPRRRRARAPRAAPLEGGWWRPRSPGTASPRRASRPPPLLQVVEQRARPPASKLRPAMGITITGKRLRCASHTSSRHPAASTFSVASSTSVALLCTPSVKSLLRSSRLAESGRPRRPPCAGSGRSGSASLPASTL